jgi:hypothetical protein
LLCDIEYERGKKAADFIAVFPDAVLIAEAKATPLRFSSKLAMDSLISDVERAPLKAVDQIVRTSALIDSRHPALVSVPVDRPRFGLVVTLEPYYQVALEALQAARASAPLPIALASCAELEDLVAAESGRPDVALLNIPEMRTIRSGTLRSAMGTVKPGENPLLRDAWNSLPFAQL